MKKICYIITLLLLILGLHTNAKTYFRLESASQVWGSDTTSFAAIQNKAAFTRLENDSVILTPAAGLRGTLQWQSSADSITWTDVPANLPNSQLAFKPQITKAYRLKITEGTCNPIYGDTMKVFAKNTTPPAPTYTSISN